MEAAKRVTYCPANQERRVKAIATWVIPKMIQSTLWTFPAAKSFMKLRSMILISTFSTTRAMRCPEVVVTILSDPTKTDPWAATIVRAFLSIRRLINKNRDRIALFITSIVQIIGRTTTNDGSIEDQMSPTVTCSAIQGPAHAFVRIVGMLGLDIDINRSSDQGKSGCEYGFQMSSDPALTSVEIAKMRLCSS